MPTKPKKPKPQKAIITITETERGTITVDMTFKPCVKTDARMTPAIQAALACLKVLTDSGSIVPEKRIAKPCTPAT